MQRPAESVWDYPRPPRAEATGRHIASHHAGAVVFDSRTAVRVLETNLSSVFRLVRDLVIRSGRSVFTKRLFSQELFLEHPRYRFTDKDLLDGLRVACRHIEDACRVLHHLRRRHLAPLPVTLGRKIAKPFKQFIARFCIEYRFHAGSSPLPTFYIKRAKNKPSLNRRGSCFFRGVSCISWLRFFWVLCELCVNGSSTHSNAVRKGACPRSSVSCNFVVTVFLSFRTPQCRL